LVTLATLVPFADKAVTAVDVAATTVSMPQGDGAEATGWLVGLGAESGSIQIWFLDESALRLASESGGDGPAASDMCRLVETVAVQYSHGSAVRRLRWCGDTRRQVEGGAESWQLASCGDDHCVRVFNITL
jgi:hypothetical protein